MIGESLCCLGRHQFLEFLFCLDVTDERAYFATGHSTWQLISKQSVRLLERLDSTLVHKKLSEQFRMMTDTIG
jgi:hypothetical protein